MVDLAAPLYRRSVPGLVDQRQEPGGVRNLLLVGDYAIEVAAPGVTKFSNIEAIRLLAHVQYDYARFALSSLESILLSRTPKYTPRAAAWPLVQLYYSAFYAGHAIMRATGRGIVRIDATLPSRITKLGQLYVGDEFELTSGTYEFWLEGIGQAQMSMSIRRVDAGAAVHISFWEQFRRFLNDVGTTAVANHEADAPQIVARIEEFFRLLASSGPLSSGQLSETRNAISYRHELAVWFPFISSASKGRPVPKLELKGNENVRLDILPKHEPRDAFTNAAHYLACLNYDLAEMIVARSRSSDFGRTWARLKKDAGS